MKGSIAPAAALIYETLMTRSQDEVVTEYGLLAEAVRSSRRFFLGDLSACARRRDWHDGKPVTPEDVIFSIEALKKNSPMYCSYYRHVVKAEKTGERDVKFTFDSPGQSRTADHRRRIAGVAEALVGRHRRQGRKRDISATTLEPPLGSGPYRIKEFVAGRSVKLERVQGLLGREAADADRPE